MLSADVTGAITWIGTGAGAVALWLTFREARRGRLASEQTAKAVAASEHRIRIGTYAYAYAQVGLVRNLVQSSNIPSAQLVFHSVKRLVHESREGSSSDDYGTQPGTVGRALRTVEHHLDLSILGKPYSMPKILDGLSGIADHLLQLEQESKFPADRASP